MKSTVPHVSLVTLNYNGTSDTIALLEALTKVTYPNFHFILIDDASEPAEVELLRSRVDDFSFVTYIENDENLGFAGGCNQGMRYAKEHFQSAFYYMLNNDATPTAGFLEPLVAFAAEHPKTGILGSMTCIASTPEYIDTMGHEFLDCGDLAPRHRNKLAIHETEHVFTMGACGSSIMLRASMLKEIGMFDEGFFINFEDADLGLRAVMYGWDCYVLPSSVVYHKINATISRFRDYTFSVRSQFNQFKAYVHNTPLTVLLLNAPFVLFRDLCIVLINTLFLRFDIVKVFLHARWKLFKALPEVRATRAQHRKHWKRSPWFVLSHQKPFLPVYIGYFIDIIIKKRKCALES